MRFAGAVGRRKRVHVRPLTRRNRQGEVYQRTETVEEQIRAALSVKPTAMIEEARVRDYTAPNYLREECLVYLIREYKSRGERRIMEELSEILLRRCSKSINKGLQNLRSEGKDDSQTVEHAFHDVVEELFDQMLDLESDKGDFLQVRFWPVVEKLKINAFNRHSEALNRAKDAVTWESVAEYEQRSGEGAEKKGGKHRGGDSQSLQKAGLSAEQRAAYLEAAREVLDHVEEPYKTAFVLHHYYDWPIETKKPGLPSISRHFAKTPRTINDWLKRADERIERWKGEMA